MTSVCVHTCERPPIGRCDRSGLNKYCKFRSSRGLRNPIRSTLDQSFQLQRYLLVFWQLFTDEMINRCIDEWILMPSSHFIFFHGCQTNNESDARYYNILNHKLRPVTYVCCVWARMTHKILHSNGKVKFSFPRTLAHCHLMMIVGSTKIISPNFRLHRSNGPPTFKDFQLKFSSPLVFGVVMMGG